MITIANLMFSFANIYKRINLLFSTVNICYCSEKITKKPFILVRNGRIVIFAW